MKNKTGIYKITNQINGDCYIGSCCHYRGLPERLYRHRYRLNRQTHPNSHLQNAWNKYGADNFIFEILEECPPEKCIEREQYYLDTITPRYNIRKKAENNFGFRHSNSTKNKISIANKNHPNHHNHGKYRFENIKTKEIVICAKFELTKKYKLDASSVSKICNHKEPSHHGWICIGKE